MFQSARLTLTFWYLLIIMFVSSFFSFAIYKILTIELDRVEQLQRLRFEQRQLPFEFRQRFPRAIDPEVIDDAKDRLKLRLIYTNVGILIFAGFAGYFLAGRTLRPIKDMVDEQNRFVTDASHELRTPLTSLKTEIEVNLKDKRLTLDKAKKLLSSNLEDVNNLQYLSDNLIKLTQYQKSSNKVFFEDALLVEIVEEAAKKVANLARHKKILIDNEVNDYTIKGDKQSLIELFVILLDNAIKYSHEGGKITITSKKTDGQVIVSVKDQGVGIDKDDIPHLFDRFYRGDKSRAKVDADGYGLGLSIAKQIVDKHHGSIGVKSELGKGTTFSIQLPLEH